jgi:hypothetical protein
LLLPAAVAAAGATLYLALDPPSADLAAQAFRADLFERAGFTVFSTAWYGGHHTPAYSVLLGPLAALAGERVLGAVAAVAAAAVFGALAGARAGVWIAPALIASLVSGRITFVLGAAFGIAAVLAAARGRAAWAAVLGVATALASPVAALFAGLAGTALALAARRSPPPDGREAGRAGVAAGVALAVAVALPTLALAAAFPEGGTFPFALSAFAPAFAAGVAVAVVAPAGSALRIGGALYALLCLAVLVVPSPVGGNATRLGALVAVPVAVHLLWPHRRTALALLALPLAYWVLQPAVRDVVRTHDDPSVDAAFFAPLVAALGDEPVRVEVPLTKNKGETVHLARHVPLARGWERQVDRDRNALFYEGELTPARWRRWLVANAVGVVAVPDGVPLDPAGEAERDLAGRGLPWLRPVAGPAGWRVYAVAGARPLAEGAATLTRIGPDGFTLRAERPGATLVRIRFTPYWRLESGRGCVEPAGDWTRVRLDAPGTVRIGARFSPARVRAKGPRCRGR